MYFVTALLSVNGVSKKEFDDYQTYFSQYISGVTPLDALAKIHDMGFLHASNMSLGINKYYNAVRRFVSSHCNGAQDVVVSICSDAQENKF